jgi:TetR/AcrR family transcriptional regulator, regulator of cefoperazone and chloramphenicol sensitivity
VTPSRSRRRSQPVRHDIRARILEAAGRLFADKGYFGATGKEICASVGANAAAVVYHFGGIADLYAAALEEAFARLASCEPRTAAPSHGADAKERLTPLITTLTRTILGPPSSSWAARLISREIIAPTVMGAGLGNPKLRLVAAAMEEAVSEVTALPHGHPVVALSCINIMALFVILPLVSREQLAELFPTASVGSYSIEETAQHLARFALRGLESVARDVKRRSKA